MNIPSEFADYLTNKPHLSHEEQLERFTKMHLREIERRGRILNGLKFSKEDAKKRIASYIKWGFEFYPTPDFVNEIDTIIDRIYS